MVSGSLSLPSSGFLSPFPHGTGTLSVSREYLALPDGPGGFGQDFTCPALLRSPLRPVCLRVRGCHPLWRGFPAASARRAGATARSYYPAGASPRPRFGLFPGRSPLLGESLLFSFPAGTKMFQFPALASACGRCHSFRMTGCPIRRSAGQGSFAPNRGFSQLITSFVASESLGIHHVPFSTFLAARVTSVTGGHVLSALAFCFFFFLYNMSKIFFRMNGTWRITDSNRRLPRERRMFRPVGQSPSDFLFGLQR